MKLDGKSDCRSWWLWWLGTRTGPPFRGPSRLVPTRFVALTQDLNVDLASGDGLDFEETRCLWSCNNSCSRLCSACRLSSAFHLLFSLSRAGSGSLTYMDPDSLSVDLVTYFASVSSLSAMYARVTKVPAFLSLWVSRARNYPKP